MQAPNSAAMEPKHAIWDEPDIGSGEKTQGQRETEELIRQIPKLPDEERPNDGDADDYDSNGALDGETEATNMEQQRSLEKDEPSSQLDDLDPVPPRG